MSLIKNFNCDNCIKKNVCKYKEVEVPEVISRVETRLDNQVYDEDIIIFSVSCKEFQKGFCVQKDFNK